MDYLLFSFDPLGYPLWREGEGPGSDWPIDVDEFTKKKILQWNENAFPLITSPEKIPINQLRERLIELNAQGHKIASELSSDNILVRYLDEIVPE